MTDAAPSKPLLTPAEVAYRERLIAALDGYVQMLNSGPGGVAQLRKMFKRDAAALRFELMTRRRAKPAADTTTSDNRGSP